MTLPPELPQRADVVVAGSGAAGLTAALAAARGGAEVLLVERSVELGGTTALGGGRVWVPCNHHSSGDSPEAARTYLHGLFSDRYPEMVDSFVDNAPRMARFVEEASAHRFVACPNYPDYLPDRPGAALGGRCLDMRPIDVGPLPPLAKSIRTPPGYLPMTHAEWEQWRYPDRFDWNLIEERTRRGIRTNGVALVAGLLEGVCRAGVRVVTGTRLTGIEPDSGGAVTAALVEGGGTTAAVRTSRGILATGGYDWDDELRAAWHPGPQRATGAPPSNTGDALRIAQAAGARLDNQAEGWWMPMLAIPGETHEGRQFYRALIRERGAPRQIMVNAAGRRFVDEAQPYNEIGKAMHRRTPGGGYPNDTAYMVFDTGFLRRYPLPGIRPGEELPGWVVRADSLAELAEIIGVDPGGLRDTVQNWNRACAQGADPEFGRGGNAYDRYCGDPDVQPNPSLGPVDEAPFYAFRVLAGTIGTKGGPVTGPDGVVLTEGGDRVEGLYAVGNASAFWTSDGYPAPGATLAVGMTMGYLAGRHAAKHCVDHAADHRG